MEKMGKEYLRFHREKHNLINNTRETDKVLIKGKDKKRKLEHSDR